MTQRDSQRNSYNIKYDDYHKLAYNFYEVEVFHRKIYNQEWSCKKFFSIYFLQ